MRLPAPAAGIMPHIKSLAKGRVGRGKSFLEDLLKFLGTVRSRVLGESPLPGGIADGGQFRIGKLQRRNCVCRRLRQQEFTAGLKELGRPAQESLRIGTPHAAASKRRPEGQ